MTSAQGKGGGLESGFRSKYCCWQRREDGLDFWVLNQPRLSLLLLSPWTLIGTIADRSRLQKLKSNEFITTTIIAFRAFRLSTSLATVLGERGKGKVSLEWFFFSFRLVGSKPHVSLAGEPSAVLCHVVIMKFYEVMRRNLNQKTPKKGKKDKARGL